MCPKRVWRHSNISRELQEFERSAPPTTTTARVVASCAESVEDMCVIHTEQCTLPDALFTSLGSVSPTWPNHSAENHKASALLTLGMVLAGNHNIEAAATTMWYSLLATAGTYLKGPDEERGGIVVAATKFGFIRYFLQRQDGWWCSYHAA